MLFFPVFPFLITRGGDVIRKMEVVFLLRSGLVLGNPLVCAGPRLQVCTFLISSWLHAGLQCCAHTHTLICCLKQQQQHKHNKKNNNNNTIWGDSVLTGEEPPPHSGELKHALPQAGGPTQSQLSRPMSSGHHISMEHRLRKKHLNSDTDASN